MSLVSSSSRAAVSATVRRRLSSTTRVRLMRGSGLLFTIMAHFSQQNVDVLNRLLRAGQQPRQLLQKPALKLLRLHIPPVIGGMLPRCGKVAPCRLQLCSAALSAHAGVIESVAVSLSASAGAAGAPPEGRSRSR